MAQAVPAEKKQELVNGSGSAAEDLIPKGPADSAGVAYGLIITAEDMERHLKGHVDQSVADGKFKLAMLERALKAWYQTPGRFRTPEVRTVSLCFFFRVSNFALLHFVSVSLFTPLQGGDHMDPEDRSNPDMVQFANALFEMELEDVKEHCGNEKFQGEKCVCSRSMRAQSYRALALAMNFRGMNNQVKWAKPVLAFFRAAWNYEEDKKAACAPLPEAHLKAWADEPTPTEDEVQLFVQVLERVYPA